RSLRDPGVHDGRPGLMRLLPAAVPAEGAGRRTAVSGESSGKLTARSAAACENAKSPRSACKCRCGGAAHGLSRGAVRELDAGDPHHPDDESPKAKKERLRDEQWRQRLANWNKPIGSPDPLPATLPIGTMATFGDVEALTQPELRPRFPQ